jgi:DNA polymerase-3 subunit delta'
MNFVGHDEAWRSWRSALAGERMHHGWILAGKKGLGKSAFALAAARELVAMGAGPQPEGMHPDIIVLDHLPATADDVKKRDEGLPYQVKRNISVDQIREMQHRLMTRPSLGSRRAIIIDPADDLEKAASNALLKSLEEPPAGSFFLLVTHRPGRLLATIRSRCRMLRFPVLPDAEVERVLMQLSPQSDAGARAAAMAAAGGSPGAALEFIEQNLGPLHDLMVRIVEEGDGHFHLRGALADAMGARPDRERMAAAIDLARAVLAERLPTAARNQFPPIIDAHEELNRLAAQVPVYNFDPGLLVMEIGGLLASAARPSEAANG